MRIITLSCIAALAMAYPACELVGLDACMGWLSNGHLPDEGELLGSLVVLGARVGQCLVAPGLAVAYATWLATAPLRA